MPQSIVASAPGSTMVFGEHAVLRGGSAIVAAIERRLQIRLTPRSDEIIDVRSFFGNGSTTCSDLAFGHPLRFVEGVFRLVRPLKGFSVEISSSIDPTVGLGSSASVTAALLGALQVYHSGTVDRQALLNDACSVIRSVQGRGSGADAAASIYGGVIVYRMDKALVSPLCKTLPLVLVYSGKKTPTPEVIRQVNEAAAAFPSVYKELFSAIDAVTMRAIENIDSPRELGLLMNQAHGLMEALGIGTSALSEIYWALRADPDVFGAKISGSGLGDAVVGLGSLSRPCPGVCLPSTVAQQGVEVRWDR